MKYLTGIVTAALTLALVHSQFISPSFNLVGSPAFHSGPQLIGAPGTEVMPNRAVLENAAREATLPQELLNPFYKNPAIAAGLAKESQLASKEFPVFHREAEKIDRSEILKIFQRAGFLDRLRRRRSLL